MIKEVIVVEGVNDTKRLKSFFDVDTIETHGLGLSRETIDPDTPGEKLRNRLNKEIPGLKNAFVLKEDARTRKKVGIEHASKEVLEEALNNLITYGESKRSINEEEFYRLGLKGEDRSADLRKKVSAHFHLGKCNAKTLFNRLNMLGITYKEIADIINL